MEKILQEVLTGSQQEIIVLENTISPCKIDSMKIGERIKDARTKMSLNQSELARDVGVKPQAVQQWVESGRLPLRRAFQIEQITEGKIPFEDIRHLTGIGKVAEITNPIVSEPISTKPPEISGVVEDKRGVLRRNGDKGRRENPRQSGNK